MEIDCKVECALDAEREIADRWTLSANSLSAGR